MSDSKVIYGRAVTGIWARVGVGVASLAIAAAIWLPLVHQVFRTAQEDYRGGDANPPRACKLAERHLRLWQDPALRRKATAALRLSNPEWDLMARGYVVLALANMSLREPGRQPNDLQIIDRIIDDTLAAEGEHGHLHFLLPYGRARPFVVQPPRSHHVDSQIGLMLGARCLLQHDERYARLLRERVEVLRERMEASPVLAAESYPDECWTYDIANGLVAMQMADVVIGTDHRDLFARWLAVSSDKLMDRKTRLLVSSFTRDGVVLDGPEGSTIWMVAHALQVIDADIAQDQYYRAKRELAHLLLGFGYAREWPRGWVGPADIDSGPPIPVLDVSAGSSGTAFIAASAFDDEEYLRALFTTLDFAGFPQEEAGALKYCASNELGDAVVLYATVLGPLWKRLGVEDVR